MRRTILLLVLLAACSAPKAQTPVSLLDAAKGAATDAVRLAASKVYDEAKARRLTLDHGPCLSEGFVRGWSLDIVHVPRTPEDDLPENQCAAHLKGETRLLELNAQGDVVGVRMHRAQ